MYGHLGYFGEFCIQFVYCSGFGIMYQVKSGNPGYGFNKTLFKSIDTDCSDTNYDLKQI
jgi:hypothetical protein